MRTAVLLASNTTLGKHLRDILRTQADRLRQKGVSL